MKNPQKIDDVLPQTQCRECSYEGCRPYAEAIVNNNETIDRCAPGGIETLNALAKLTHTDPTPYIEKVNAQKRPPSVVRIRENECIGCTKCIQACPVDAIIGSAKLMHSIITDECTGCNLCIEPCPVDCIDIIPIDKLRFNRDTAKARYNAKKQRLESNVKKQFQTYENNKMKDKKDYLLAAVARAKKSSNKQ